MGKENGIAFEGATLEEAYSKATAAFECSLTELTSEIIQTPSSGFMGMFKKNAIIKAYGKIENKNSKTKKEKKSSIKIKDFSHDEKKKEESSKEDVAPVIQETTSNTKESPIFDNFYTKEGEQDFDQSILDEIALEIDRLFNHLQYKLDPVKVSLYDNETIFIEFQGEDSALLIGKEGYRYKAVSYILFNWIHDKYGKMIRLEIAEFLHTQEENMKKYLAPIIETIHEEGFYKTKTLDGILVHIALTQLREAFPDKYIAVKNNVRGEKYILVNEYRH